MSPFSHFWSEGARFMLVPQVIRQYSNVKPAIGLLAAQRLDHLVLGAARTMAGDHRLHRGQHRFGSDFQLRQFVGGFLDALALQHEQRVDPVGVGKRAAQHDRGVVGQKTEFGGDALGLQAGLADIVDRLLHGVDRTGGVVCVSGVHSGVILGLKFFQPVADIGGLFRRALRIDEAPADNG